MTGTIFLEDSEFSIGEANGPAFIAIVRTGDLSGPATIEYGITPATATDGLDYIGATGTVTVTMEAGQDRVVVPVQIINDEAAEPTESFAFSITNFDSGSQLLFPRTARVDILDDENPVVDPTDPPLTSPYSVTEQPVITGLTEPMAFEFAPQDSSLVDASLVYVAEKSGVIKVFDLDSGSFRPDFIDLSAKVNNNTDRGLMDIALDPDFPNNPYLYAFYVVDPPETAGKSGNAGPDGGGNRFSYVVRLTADASTGFTTAVPGSEVILVGGAGDSLTDISGAGAIDSTSNFNQSESGYNAQTGQYVDNYLKVDSRSHAGGSLVFGPDGALYVSTGDGTSYNVADPRSVSVQDNDSLSGKILRIDPMTGLGLPDNPFVQPGDSLAANHAKVFQLGLRNPFSTGFDQNGHLVITNTGWYSWEEIETGQPGANFGWPYYEGGDNGVLERAPGYQNLPGAAAFYAAVESGAITVTPALRGFSHSSSEPGYQMQAIVGGDAVYTGSQYAPEFQNHYFFNDVTNGEVFVVDLNDRRDLKYLYTSGKTLVHFSQGPDGYVYYTDLSSGAIGRLLIEGGATIGQPYANDDFVATNEDAPLVLAPGVLLTNDIDPDNDTLIVSAVGNAVNGSVALVGGNVRFTPATNHNGTASFTYTVSDGNGGTDFATVHVTVAPINDAPVAVNDSITTPLGGSVDINVLGNDVDVDGDRLTASLVAGPAHGTVTPNANGTLTYTPNAGFTGPDSFTYTASDGAIASNAASVSVTVLPANVIVGTSANNSLTGTSGADLIQGLGGADNLSGLAGNDTLEGGTGNDKINGGDGNDLARYAFGDGADSVTGGAGTDSLSVSGTSADDILDVVFNGTALTKLEGGTLSSVESVVADLLAGNDLLNYTGTTSALTVNLASGAVSGFGSIAGVENLTGGSGHDTLIGDAGANSISGGSKGEDWLTGGAGNDTLSGGSNVDDFLFAPGFGRDVIADFDHNPSGGQDLINIIAFGITAATFASRVTVVDAGNDLVVSIDNDPNQEITLTGVPSVGSITTSDFILA